MKPMTIIVLIIAVVAAGWALSDYIPRAETTDTKLLKSAVVHAQERQAAAEKQLEAKEQEIEHLHTLVVHDTGVVRRQKLAYDFGKTHLDTTSVDSLKAQLTRADSVIVSQAQTIVDALGEAAAAEDALFWANKAIEAASYRGDRLADLNASVQRELDAKNRGQWKHDAKVVVGTLAVRALVQLVRQ